ncbi:MAG TPA: helix-turn-helix transcriptional regulator [Thermoanaerobaculia bacterium]|jgi:tetratricopeptide (TPR) repeat protein|nr:helix-turn-helix transcriptional regulator [Thermoanaerobaculia bacterium]
MAKQKRSAEALTLHYLRNEAGWSQKQLADALGFVDEKQISRYETDGRQWSRELLYSLVAPLGRPPEAVDALLFVYRLVARPPAEEAASLVSLTAAERGRIVRATLAAGTVLTESVHDELILRKKRQKSAAALREAGELLDVLKAANPQERRDLITVFPGLRTWAMAVKLCEASVRAAAHKVEDALELADLALFTAGKVPGEPCCLCRLQGWCGAHVANSRRVATDFEGADEAFARALSLWEKGAACDSELLPEWRLLDLEASLRREQHRFPEALELLDRAMAASRGNEAASGRILLKKSNVFEQSGDLEGALAALQEAKVFVEACGDPQQIFALRFNTVDVLSLLNRPDEAARWMPAVRELALEQGHEMSLRRLVWLEARVAAGLGRIDEAMAGLEQVRLDFTDLGLPYEAALSSLELAVLWLEAGRTAEVRKLAAAMTWIFKAKGIQEEALAALKLFRDAAEREAATVELTRRVLAEIRRSEGSAPSLPKERRGRD